MHKKRAQIHGVYFTTESNGNLEQFESVDEKGSSQLIVLDLEPALKVPFIKPMLENEQWALKSPNGEGFVPISLMSHDLLTAAGLLSICKQLNDGSSSVQVRTESELWIADYLCIPLKVPNLYSLATLLEFNIPLSLTPTFKRLKTTPFGSQLWRFIVWQWQYFGASRTEEDLKKHVPMAFIKEFYLDVLAQPTLRYPIFRPVMPNECSNGTMKMRDPFLLNDQILLKLVKSFKETNDKSVPLHDLNLLLEMDHFSEAHKILKSADIGDFVSDHFEWFLKCSGRTCMNLNIKAATCNVFTLRNAESLICTENGSVCFHFNDNRILYRIRKLNHTRDIASVAFYHPYFSCFVHADETGRLDYALSEMELKVQMNNPICECFATIYSKMERFVEQ